MKIKDFLLERYFAKYEFNTPYLLCCSDCESLSIEELLRIGSTENEAKILQDNFLKVHLGYTESQGHPALKEAISHLYTTVKKEHVLVAAGAEEAIFIFMNVVLNPGDNIIVHTPCYQSLTEIAVSIGAEVTHWTASYENSWRLDVDFLEKSIKSNTKGVVINCPHNPTGYQMSLQDYQRVVEICRKNNMVLFSDEVYKLLDYGEDKEGQTSLPSACDLYEKGISLGVMSKSFGLAGLRIGWLICKDRELYAKFASYKDYTSICNSAPSEYLSVVALQKKDILIARTREIVAHNVKLVDDFFNRYKKYFSWVKPSHGPISFPKLANEFEALNTEEFCEDLLKKKGVLLLPGTCYSFGSHYFRLGLGRMSVPEALQKVEEYLKEGHLDVLLKQKQQ